jgi:hypothetical protein
VPDELGSMWKEAAVTYFKLSAERLSKTTSQLSAQLASLDQELNSGPPES